jgi:hypothetical protein
MIILVLQKQVDIEAIVKLRRSDMSAVRIPVTEHQEMFYELFVNQDLNKKVFVMTFQSSSLMYLDNTIMIYFPKHYKVLVKNMKKCKA